jgi:hypothetical protein
VSKMSRIIAVATALAALAGQRTWAAADGSSSAPTTNPAGTSSAPSETLQQVTVTAHRLELEKRVSKFVNQIAAAENGDEGLARWEAPSVCPLVSGLPRRDGEYIFERLSEIAQLVGVPIDKDSNCRPNLFVLVTDQPENLLRLMEKRNRPFTFGVNQASHEQVPASVVDRFIQTSRPVRAWYNLAEKDAWGQDLSYCAAIDIALINCSPNDTECYPPHFNPTRKYQCGRGTAGGSHLTFNNLWWFKRVFLIVDSKQLHEVKLGQLADFIAMAGFAKIKATAQLGDARTILKLFDGAAPAAPLTLTDWDQAFLKSLYSTDQKARLQRSQIAHQMVPELKP